MREGVYPSWQVILPQKDGIVVYPILCKSGIRTLRGGKVEAICDRMGQAIATVGTRQKW